jgi:hypothetical protein
MESEKCRQLLFYTLYYAIQTLVTFVTYFYCYLSSQTVVRSQTVVTIVTSVVRQLLLLLLP